MTTDLEGGEVERAGERGGNERRMTRQTMMMTTMKTLLSYLRRSRLLIANGMKPPSRDVKLRLKTTTSLAKNRKMILLTDKLQQKKKTMMRFMTLRNQQNRRNRRNPPNVQNVFTR